eukprot:Skav206268  [mRNA]  locus=scaffold888:78616:83671:- [translate_table: standard]
MVCQKCEKKLAKLANPDVWREGGRNNTMRDKDKGARTINENMLLKHKTYKQQGNPYAAKCKHCKCALHQAGVPASGWRQGNVLFHHGEGTWRWWLVNGPRCGGKIRCVKAAG